MNKDYYVTLTGGKNNAGDFLIKYRAFKLFEKLRLDRTILDFNEWEAIDNDRLNIINKSKALILLGGPGILSNMHPNIYPLRDNLDDIKVPIIMMGLGWKDAQGNWENTHKIVFGESSKILLDRIDSDGFISSVRDYHTLNTLNLNGYKNIFMTGCPAYYDFNYMNKEVVLPQKIQKVAFSLGVSFIGSNSMLKQMKQLVIGLKKYFTENTVFEVVFHHSLDLEKTREVYHTNSSDIACIMHNEFLEWLGKNKIAHVDISGSAENLINYYSTIDLHIGYRVHAHIFMNSISRPSILISEDGRAKAVKNVIGGIVLDGYSIYRMDFLSKILSKIIKFDRYKSNKFLLDELLNSLDYELNTDFQRIKNSRKQIDDNFNIMKKFIQQLP